MNGLTDGSLNPKAPIETTTPSSRQMKKNHGPTSLILKSMIRDGVPVEIFDSMWNLFSSLKFPIEGTVCISSPPSEPVTFSAANQNISHPTSNYSTMNKCLKCDYLNLDKEVLCFKCGSRLVNQNTHEECGTGAVRSSKYPKDQNFPARYDLMMRNEAGMRRLAETFGEGFEKYGADNCWNGFPASVLISHAQDHIVRYLKGDMSEDHLAHSAWNLLMLCWVEENRPDLLDITIPPGPVKATPVEKRDPEDGAQR